MRRRSGRNPKSPAFQFYPADFLSDGRTAAMTYEERGVLITLLSFAWLDGGIPADHSRIQRILRMNRAEFARVWAGIGQCFAPHPEKPEVLVNARMERERASQAENREARKAASRAANAVRWNKDGSDSDPIRTEVGSQSDPTLSRLPSPDPRPSTPCVDIPPSRPAAKPKPQPSGDHSEFIAWWCEAFQKATGAPYGFQGGKDGSHVKRILGRDGGAPEAVRRATLLLASAPDWIARGGVDLGTLDTQWNKLVSAGAVGVATGSKQLALQSLNGNERTIPKLAPLPTTKGGYR